MQNLEKPKKQKKPSVAKLKKKADEAFSQYVRLRDSDQRGIAECITCGARKYWKSMQAGHFVSRTVSLLRYDEQNVNAQCVSCNMFKQGEQYLYSRALDEKYGSGTAEELMSQRHSTHKYTAAELESIIQEARSQVKFYLSEKHTKDFAGTE